MPNLNLGLSGWLGRQFVGDPWHWMHDGGSHALCGESGVFSAGPKMEDTFRGPEQVPVKDRCRKCERLFKERSPAAARKRALAAIASTRRRSK